MYKCGESCLGFTYQNSASLLFFDINSGEWDEADLGASQNWIYLEATGDLVYAVSEAYLVAYNARTSSHHALAYTGTRLSDNFGQESYRVGENLAMMVTDQKMYIFDIELDSWQEYAYGLPPEYAYPNNFYITADYAVASLARSYPGSPKNIVYSLPQHAFNQADPGISYISTGHIGTAALDHGFAGYIITDSTANGLLGYSALTNQFATVDVLFDNQGLNGRALDPDHAELRTVFVAECNEIVDPGISNTQHMWGYDTRLGSWSYQAMGYNPTEIGFWHWQAGGQFAVMGIKDQDTFATDFIFYSGQTGQMWSEPWGFYDEPASPLGLLLGGQQLIVFEGDVRARGYNPLTGANQTLTLDDADTYWTVQKENYLSFARYGAGDTRMDLHFYNGVTNTWTTTDIWSDILGFLNTGMHLYVHAHHGTDVEIIFYSPIHDSYVKRNYPAHPSATYSYTDYLGAAWSGQGASCLYDSRTGLIQDIDYEFSLYSLTDNSCIARDPDGVTLHGYSALSGQWTSLTSADAIHYWATEYLGMAKNDIHTKYFAYNGLRDAWVELTPTGSYVGQSRGGKTMLVLRTDILYAFNPEAATTGIHDDDPPEIEENTPPGAPKSYALYPNYPNPFNPTTTVKFDLPRAGQVSLRIYDLAGRLVRTVVDEMLPAGSYSRLWDGSDGAGNRVASGVYYLRMASDEFVNTQKMLLVK